MNESVKFPPSTSVAAAVKRRLIKLRPMIAPPSARLRIAVALLVSFSAAAQPVIVSPPQSISQINGFPAWLSVSATGAPPLSFQWRRGGTNVVGAASNVFGWPAVQPGNTGSYDVVITNISGGVTSALVTLTVLANTASCSLTNLRLTPLNELGLNTHKGYAGGLYPGGLNYRPRAHDEAGRFIARSHIFPRNFAGARDTNSGKVAVVSIGMSNTTQEWATGAVDGTNDLTVAFKYRADHDSSKHPLTAIVDLAQGGRDARQWTNASLHAWTNVAGRLTSAGVSSNQVQVAWIKLAVGGPSSIGAFPVHAVSFQQQLEQVVRAARARFTNLAIIYLSSRVRSYAADASLNPEPYAYEESFSVKWLIEQQLGGALNYDPARGPVVAPWLAWGPYLWADGTVGRSDGLNWNCSDLRSDFTHPSQAGVFKVADQLLNFFKTDPTATTWFLRTSVTGAPPVCAPTAIANAGLVPMTVSFAANASDSDGTVVETRWTFDDGGFATNANPVKTFLVPGAHTARLTVTDNLGNTTASNVAVNVSLTYELWRDAQFTAAELTNSTISGVDADLDDDALLNFAEYALDLNPHVNSRTGLPTPAWTTVGGTNYLTLVTSRNAAVTDAQFVVEVSSDLTTWFSGPAHTTVLDNSPALLRIRANTPATAAQHFIKLRITP